MSKSETITTRLLQAFPRSIINRYGEFIAYRGVPESFQLDTCENEEEVKCKVLEWLSRAAFKTKPFASKKINDMFHCYMIKGINTFLGTSFSQSDMEIIYIYLGNNINREKCLKFIRSGYDMGVLKKEAVNVNKQEAIRQAIEDLKACKPAMCAMVAMEKELDLAISALEQQLNGGWILCKDRMPEENGHYLVTYHEWSKGEYLPEFDLTYAKILRFYRGEFKMPVCCNDKIEQDIGREVLAWMPLPEPYREENQS